MQQAPRRLANLLITALSVDLATGLATSLSNSPAGALARTATAHLADRLAHGLARSGRGQPARRPAPSLAPSLVALAASAALLVGCGGTRHRIASLYDTSGQQAALGTPAARGAQLAFDEPEARGLAQSSFDTRSDPAVARSIARDAAAGHAVGAGFTDTDIALGAAQEFSAAKRAFFVTGATDPSIPARAGRGVYMVAFGDDAQAVAAADFIRAKFGARALVVADQRYDYTRTLAEFFVKAFRANGGTIVDRIDPRAQGFAREFAANAGDSRPDAVFLALEPDLIPSVLAAVRKALPATPLVGGDAFDLRGIERTDASAAGGGALYFTTHAWLGDGATPEAARFATRYRAKFGEEPTAFAALGYDAAKIAQRTARLELPRETSEPSAETLVEQALRVQEPPYEGLSGTISYRNGPVPDKDVWIIRAEGGRKTLAERARPERAKAR